MKRLLLALLATASTAFAAERDRAASTVILDEAAVKNLNIETVEATEGDFEETLFALGRIHVLPGRRAVVSSRVPGRALNVSARPDHPVKQGDEVVLIESRQPGDPPPSVSLKAPIDGLIAELKVVPGQPVTPDDSLLSIVDLSVVYAVAQVPEHLAASLREGLPAHIRVAALPERVFEAQLEHTGTLADEEAGALEAAFNVPNPDLLLRPGMRAEFSIVVSKRAGVLSVPREAVQGDPASRFVYVRDFELKNAFVKAPVQIGAENDRFVEITNGLFPGDEVVTRGAYALAFAGRGSVSLKEALDAAHGHAHNPDGSEMTPEQRAAAAAGKSGDGGHSHEHGFTPLTIFFAATSALFLLLLILSLALRRTASRA